MHFCNNLLMYEKLDRLDEAETGLVNALRILKSNFGNESSSLTNLLNCLALVLGKKNKYGEAEEMYKESLRIQEKRFGRDSYQVAATLNNLASFYVRIREARYEEAEAMYEFSSPMYSPFQFFFLFMQNRYKEVMRIENLHADDLGVAYSGSPLECAMSLNNLALLYIQQSRFTDAEIMYAMHLIL